MKTILLLILSAFTAFAATTYPVLTDNANRTFSGGATNLPLLNATNRFTGPLQLPSVTAGRVPIIDAGGNLTNSAVTPTALGYLDATSSVQTQLDSKPTVALTNLALLNGTNVFTGTNTFSGPLNAVKMRVLFTTNNVFITNIAAQSYGYAGGITIATNGSNYWVNSTYLIPSNIFTCTLPALGSREIVGFYCELEKTNTSPSVNFFGGVKIGTNRVYINTVLPSTGAAYTYYRATFSQAIPIAAFQNMGSTSVQMASGGNASGAIASPITTSFVNTSYVDTASPFEVSFEMGPQTPSGALSNILIKTFTFYAWEPRFPTVP